jgi:hypothetical protein
MSLPRSRGSQVPLSQWPAQYAPKPLSLASVKSWKAGDGVQVGSRKKPFPFQPLAKVSHHWMSAWLARERRMWWWRERTRVLVSMSLRRKILPAGITLAAKASFPMRERRALLVHFCKVVKVLSSTRRLVSLSCGRLMV